MIRILVHAPNWLGDHAMAFPFYYALRDRFPDSEIHIVGRSWVAGLVPPGIAQVWSHTSKMPPAEVIREWRLRKFDLGFTLSPSFRSALTLYRSGATFRIGYRGQAREIFFRSPARGRSFRIPPYNIHEHRSLSYLRLLTPYLMNGTTAEDYLEEFRNIIEPVLPPDVQKIKISSPYIAICPGSVAPSKVYPIDFLARVTAGLPGRYHIVLLGTRIESESARELISLVPESTRSRITNLCEATSLPQLFMVLKGASLVIANDSGVAHMTSLSHTPLVSFQGMGRVTETVMLNKQKIILQRDLPCSPCMRKVCPRKGHGYLECLRSIKPEDVIEAAGSLLSPGMKKNQPA